VAVAWNFAGCRDLPAPSGGLLSGQELDPQLQMPLVPIVQNCGRVSWSGGHLPPQQE